MATASLFMFTSTCPALAADVRYACADGTQITARFSDPSARKGSASLAFVGSSQRHTLPQVLSADGGRYADASLEFWIKGQGATLTRAGETTKCQPVEQR
jgi:membrane-bound inhibitor of C-type lysozyme